MSNNHWQKDKRVGVDDLVLLNTVCWSISSGKYSSALFDQLIFHLLDFNFLKTNAAMDLKCSIVDKKQNALNGIFQPLRVLGSYDIMIILIKLRYYIILCSDIRDCNMREFEEAVHGRLDLHLHRTCPHLCQPIQGFVFVFVLYLHLHRTCPQIKGFVVAVIVLVVIPEDSHCRSDYSNWLQITLLTFPPVNKHLKVLFFSSKLAKASLKHKDRGKIFFLLKT